MAKKNSSLSLVPKREAIVEWKNYARIKPGQYAAFCKKAKWYKDPQYKRWVCILLFNVLDSNLNKTKTIVPMWMNGGSGVSPRASRRSRYFPEWVKANGCPPLREDRLSPSIFSNRMATVVIGDVESPAPYSTVRQILSWDTGSGSQLITHQGGMQVSTIRNKKLQLVFGRKQGG